MAERRVRKSQKDQKRNITGLCHAGETWSPRSKADVISDIESGLHKYYTEEQTPKAYVEVYKVDGVKHIKTNADKTSKNNLDNLPDC